MERSIFCVRFSEMERSPEGVNICTRNVSKRRVKILVTIVDRGLGQRVVELCTREGSDFHLSFMGRGTANSEIMDILGLGESKKDIVLSVAAEEHLPGMMEALRAELELDQPGGGIAFTIPISSVGGPMTLQFISGAEQPE